ncbi:MAG: hypothetical protein MUE85_24490 [Microscillaceae bacterium]|nr:hypothetical protein [Microscillaceae bacterium]
MLKQRLKLLERLETRQKLVAIETILSKLIYARDVDERGFGRIRSKGDQALFGGYSTQQNINGCISNSFLSFPLSDKRAGVRS